DTKLPYTLHFHPLEKNASLIVDEDNFSVEAFEVVHRIDCWGFLFREKKKPRRINIEAVKKYNIPVEFFENLKRGEDFMDGDNIIKNELVTIANKPAKSYAYSADTLYMESLAEKFRDVNMLYHEATYLKDKMEKAKSRFHSTSEQAAMLAKLANAKKLLIGHFSSTYETLDEFLHEATAVFSNTQLALEGQTYIVN
ncbi:MAG: ribonuclease Z, partial [Parafilimonas sp.]